MRRSLWLSSLFVLCFIGVAASKGYLRRRKRDKPPTIGYTSSSSDDLHLTLSELDNRLASTLDKIKGMLPFVIGSVEEDIADNNKNQLLIGLANFFGMLFGVAGVINDRPLTDLSAGEQVQLSAQLLYGYGYWGPPFYSLEDAHVDCGKYEFDQALHDYSFLTDLGSTYSFLGYGSSSDGYLTADNDPHLLSYYLTEFNHAMKRALYCLIKRDNQDAKTLATYIDLYTQLAGDRLSMTQELIDSKP